MTARLVQCGEFAAGVGGEFERECARQLRDNLPEEYVVATNVNIFRGGTGGGEFYECDVVLSAPGVCDVLEMKCIRPNVVVFEDLIRSQTGFFVDQVFSKLDHKAKILTTRLQKSPFPSGPKHRSVRIGSQVVVPSDTNITFKFNTHATSKRVMTLAEVIEKYRRFSNASPDFRDSVTARENVNGWSAYSNESMLGQRRTGQHLGRFVIRRHIRQQDDLFEYFALDEPPCQMEVFLREFPFDPTLHASQLQEYLRAVARETKVLMKLRHPHIACVIGHFQTGASWVQVSDWFEGERLEDSWAQIAESSIWDKINIFLKIINALEFCHERGVFHRNVSAESVRIAPDLSDVRLVGFDCALDLSATLSTNSSASNRRDPRLIPPEDLAGGTSNPRLSDIFQAGVLLYRLLENGAWPFASTFEFATSSEGIRAYAGEATDRETEALRAVAIRMLNICPENRPDLLSKLAQELQAVLA
jgi:serine/threonine protein kinase